MPFGSLDQETVNRLPRLSELHALITNRGRR
jgi:hypothetical protein